MTDKPAAIEAEFFTFKHVPTRKVFQLILELPEENIARAFEVLGHPNGKQIPVAVARLIPTASREAVEAKPDDKPPRRFDSLPLPQQAALLCQDEALERYAKRDDPPWAMRYVFDAPEWLREQCGVTSRADILPGTEAAERFFAIRDGFALWKRGYE